MAYKEEQAQRLRNLLWESGVEAREIKMMGGCCFMVDDKMCLGVLTEKSSGNDYLMARLGPEQATVALEAPGVRPMDFTGKSMKDYVFIDNEVLIDDTQLEKWVQQALAFNPFAKASKRRKKKPKD